MGTLGYYVYNLSIIIEKHMNYTTFCKIGYSLFSIPTTMLLRMKGIKTKGLVYSCGILFASMSKGSELRIGRNCRFMNWSMGNLIGLNHRSVISTSCEGAKLKIGNNCSFSGVSIWCFKSITLGNNVRIGANCLIMDGDAHQDDPRSGENKPILIEDNVWIGGNVVVKKGVTIGRNSVIGMNSIVTKNIPANCIAFGNPCVAVKYFDDKKINEIEEYFK